MLAFAACTKRESSSSERYRIRDTPAPALFGNVLKLQVESGGGGFKLRWRVKDGIAEIWLVRTGFGVDSPITTALELSLPPDVLQQPSIVLYSPEPRRYVLK